MLHWNVFVDVTASIRFVYIMHSRFFVHAGNFFFVSLLFIQIASVVMIMLKMSSIYGQLRRVVYVVGSC